MGSSLRLGLNAELSEKVGDQFFCRVAGFPEGEAHFAGVAAEDGHGGFYAHGVAFQEEGLEEVEEAEVDLAGGGEIVGEGGVDHHEISQQVDLLCNDLVRAYQDMAQQLNMTQTAAEYGQTLANELDVEGVLRRTMEWVLRKLGPVNAAIYVPSNDHYFALGAYLNLDTQADAQLIDTMAKTVVEQVRGGQGLWVEEDRVLDELFGED